MKRILFILLTAFMAMGFNLQAQNDTINNYDDQDRKHGTWVKKYSNGQVRYEAEFEHGKPTGTTKRYHRNGNLKAVMKYQTPKKVFTELYNKDGEKQAEGIYNERKKDSVWTFFDEDERIMAKDNYKSGKRHGKSLRFFRNEDTSYVVHWRDGKRDGEVRQYFDNGKEKLVGFYSDGDLKGTLTIFYPSGLKKVEGQYENNVRDGKWVYYSEEGDTTKVVKYIDGTPENEDQLEREETKEVRELENNEGKYGDPRDMLNQRNRRNQRNQRNQRK
ncbi:MAG: toxin-antitoxin system YwqK family antitoxin [Bacteroidota bacterium]